MQEARYIRHILSYLIYLTLTSQCPRPRSGCSPFTVLHQNPRLPRHVNSNTY